MRVELRIGAEQRAKRCPVLLGDAPERVAGLDRHGLIIVVLRRRAGLVPGSCGLRGLQALLKVAAGLITVSALVAAGGVDGLSCQHGALQIEGPSRPQAVRTHCRAARSLESKLLLVSVKSAIKQIM
jgi:hypothetical protein